MLRYRIYCGPILTKDLAALLTSRMYTYVGTDAVYVITTLDAIELIRLLNHVSSGFKTGDVRYISTIGI
jgi:hypothetical protein